MQRLGFLTCEFAVRGLVAAAKLFELSIAFIDRRLLQNDQTLQRLDVGRQGVRCDRHQAILRERVSSLVVSARCILRIALKRSRYTANCGCQVRTGLRQSIPSSSIDSCADVR